MSEENQVQQEGQESVEQQQTETQQVEVKLSADEEKAVARGWMPKEDWVAAGNEEDDWKPAKLFNEHGEMIGKLRSQEKKLQDTERALQFMHQKNQEIYETGYQAALKSLRKEKREALAEGDLVKADEIDEKIEQTSAELHKARQQQAPKPQQVDPEHMAWLERNSWYNEGVMQKFADALAIEYIRVNNGQVTPADVRDYVEKEVKKEFPQKFRKTAQAAPSPDGEGRGTGKTASNGLDSRLAKAKSEMSEEHRAIMRTMLKSTGMSEKEYLALYLS